MIKIFGLETGDLTLIGSVIGLLIAYYVWVKVSIAKVFIEIENLKSKDKEIEVCLNGHKRENKEEFSEITSKLDKILFLLIEQKK